MACSSLSQGVRAIPPFHVNCSHSNGVSATGKFMGVRKIANRVSKVVGCGVKMKFGPFSSMVDVCQMKPLYRSNI